MTVSGKVRRQAVFFQLRLRLSLQNTTKLLNPDSLTQTGPKTGVGHFNGLIF